MNDALTENKKLIGGKIRKRRLELGYSQHKLAQLVGYNDRSTINRIESGERDFPKGKLLILAKVLRTSVGYLLGDLEDANVEPQKITVPLVGSVACGVPIEAIENVTDHIEIDKINKADYALRCVGDSMIGANIHDGDIVFIKKMPMVENGEIAVVRINGDVTLKKFKRNERTGEIRLKAANPDFDDIVLNDDGFKEIEVMGKCIGVLSKTK